MSKVKITYNPFTTKTDILVNNEPVQSTSKLYRYRNTPMQDWVGSFLSDLVEHCNDDDLCITFKGLQFNYDDLAEEVNIYKSKNRDVEITLADDICKSQIARIGALQTIIDDIKNQELVPELKTKEIIKAIDNSFSAVLEVITVSANDALKTAVVNALAEHTVVPETTERGVRIIDNDKSKGLNALPCENDFDVFECPVSFTNSKYATLNIVDTLNTNTQENCYYRYIKKAITAPEKPVILIILGANSASDKAEFLALIADQYKLQGKRNKERFIFVAENLQSAKKYLYSDYAIKNVQLFGIDEVGSMREIIKKYMEEYCLVEKINAVCAATGNIMSVVRNKLEDSANRNKSTEDLDKLLSDIRIELRNVYCDKCSIENLNNSTATAVVNTFLTSVVDDYRKIFAVPFTFLDGINALSNMLDGKSYNKSIPTEGLKEKITTFANTQLKSKISEFLHNMQKQIDFKKCRIIYSDKLAELYTKGGVGSCFSSIESSVKAIGNQADDSINKIISVALQEIEDIEIVSRYKSNGGMFSSILTELHEKKYKFYEGIIESTYSKLDLQTSSYPSLSQDQINASVQEFKENMQKTAPILEKAVTAISECVNEYNIELENTKNKYCDELLSAATAHIKKLQEQAKISAQDQERLNYIDSLSGKLLSTRQV